MQLLFAIVNAELSDRFRIYTLYLCEVFLKFDIQEK